MDKVIIGFSLGFNTAASIIKEGVGVLCSISQERLSREKNTKKIPIDAIIACIQKATQETSVTQIDNIGYSHSETLSYNYLYKYSDEPEYFKHFEDKGIGPTEALFEYIKEKVAKATAIPVKAKTLTRVEHHHAHIYSCYPVYRPFVNQSLLENNTLVTLVADGFGDGYSSTLTIESYNLRTRLVDSVGLVYQFFTGALGFKQHQHEGKVTGLAAHCERTDKNFPESREKALETYGDLLELLTGERELHKPSFFVKSFKNGYEYNDCGYYVNVDNLEPLKENEIEMVKESTIIDFDHFLRLQSTIYKFVQDRLGPDYNKDDILDYLEGNKGIPSTMKTTPWELAYTVQYFAEQVILNWLSLVEGTNPEGNNNILFAAGGLFANVKLNQKIKDTGKFKKVFISPPMGDEGTALGAAEELASVEFVDKYSNFGPDIIINGGTHINHDGSLAAVIREAKENPRLQVLSFENDEDGLVEKITDLLASEKIVHVCRNREEFGPRALMNHSTLYTAQDPNGTHTLNQAMGRSEYMPYCPVCKNTSADKLFKDYKVGEESCRFMAMTMDCLPGVKEKYRGGVHVDNTARAQFIYEEDKGTKFAWKLLDSYEKKTGNLMMINTSFNVHNTPTCNLASDCWEAWKYSDFVGAALVLQDHIIIKKFSGQLDLEK